MAGLYKKGAAAVYYAGIATLALALFGAIFPHSSFHTLILPLAHKFSRTGVIRNEAFFYQQWTGIAIYLLMGAGFFVACAGFAWRRAEARAVPLVADALPQVFPRLSARAAIVLAALVAAGFILRCVNMRMSYWGDEMSTLIYIKSFKFWYYPELGDHWLFVFLAVPFQRLFGEHEVVIRLPAFLASLAMVPAAYFCGRRFISHRQAVFFAAMLAFSAYLIQYANDARGYSFLGLCGMASSFLFLRMITGKAQGGRWAFGFGALTALGWLSHFYYCWVWVAQILAVTALSLRAGMLSRSAPASGESYGRVCALSRGLWGGAAAAFLVYGPRFIPAVLLKYVDWQGVGDGPVSISMWGNFFAGTFAAPAGLLFLGLVIAGMAAFWKEKERLLVFYPVVFALIPFIFLHFAVHRAFSRYFIYMVPMLLFFAARGAGAFARDKAWVLAVLLSGYILLQVPGLSLFYSYRHMGRQDYRQVSAYLEQRASAGDNVYAIGQGAEFMRYYMRNRAPVFPGTIQDILPGSGSTVAVLLPEHRSTSGQVPLTQKDLVRAGFKKERVFPGIENDIIVYSRPALSGGR